MKLEKQVCSLELAKKLKELGVKQESLWYWNQTFEAKRKPHPYLFEVQGWDKTHHKYSAFTVAELGEMRKDNMQKILDNINAGVKAGIEKAQASENSVQLVKKQDVLDLLEDIIKKYPLDNDDMQDVWLRSFRIGLIELRGKIKALTGESK